MNSKQVIAKKLSEVKLKLVIKYAEENGAYAFSAHSEQRLNERKISIQEIRQVIRKGQHY